MKIAKSSRFNSLLFGAVALFFTWTAWGAESHVLHLEVVPEAVPSPKITLSWDTQVSGATNIIYRRLLGETGSNWGTARASVGYPTASYVDTDVVTGTVYEYKVKRPAVSWYPDIASYAVAGIEAPLVEGRGKLILVVDNTLTNALATELTLLEQDLIGDGWQVIRHDSPRHGSGTAEDLKAWILAKYNEDPTNTKGLFLFGHLPIVKSGYINADGHGYQPHATDLFYGDINETWTDTGNYTYGTVPNVPGDGIYDQSFLFGVELGVGRVDLADMPAWSDNETELMRNYLRKDHLWRHALVTDPRKAIFKIDPDNLYMEHGGLHSLFHTEDVVDVADWNPEATTNAYTWGVGFGDWDGSNYADVDYKMTFVINFGSHKQLFEKSNNAMRAILAMPDYGLTCAWGARPAWFIHHMGLGETIGYSAFRTQNNLFGDYSPAGQYDHLKGYVHVNLMGDPTLRMYPLAAPTQLSATSNLLGEVSLSWNASEDVVDGYHVYRSESMAGPFVRQTGSLITTTYFEDSSDLDDTNFYMVRAVRLEEVPAGSFYNPSQGAFAELVEVGDGSPADPSSLQATATGETTIDLSWSDNSNNETGFVVERKTTGSFAVITTNSANDVSFSDSGLSSGVTYTYHVKAINDVGPSEYAPEASATTVVPSAPDAPSVLQAARASETSINLSWIDNSSDETGFVVERKTTGSFAEIATVAADATTYSDSGLTTSVTYTYRVMATNAIGGSAYTAEASATTTPPSSALVDEDFSYADGSLSNLASSAIGLTGSYTDSGSGKISGSGVTSIAGFSTVAMSTTLGNAGSGDEYWLSYRYQQNGRAYPAGGAGSGLGVGSETYRGAFFKIADDGTLGDGPDYQQAVASIQLGDWSYKSTNVLFETNVDTDQDLFIIGKWTLGATMHISMAVYDWDSKPTSEGDIVWAVDVDYGGAWNDSANGFNKLVMNQSGQDTDVKFDDVLVGNTSTDVGVGTSGDPFVGWASLHGLSGVKTDDDDSDGMSDFHEYALGGNPTNSADTGTVGGQMTGAGSFAHIYWKRTDDASLVYTLVDRTNLLSGVSSTNDQSSATSGPSGVSNFESVTNLYNTTGIKQQFIQLIVE